MCFKPHPRRALGRNVQPRQKKTPRRHGPQTTRGQSPPQKSRQRQGTSPLRILSQRTRSQVPNRNDPGKRGSHRPQKRRRRKTTRHGSLHAQKHPSSTRSRLQKLSSRLLRTQTRQKTLPRFLRPQLLQSRHRPRGRGLQQGYPRIQHDGTPGRVPPRNGGLSLRIQSREHQQQTTRQQTPN